MKPSARVNVFSTINANHLLFQTKVHAYCMPNLMRISETMLKYPMSVDTPTSLHSLMNPR